MPAALKGELRNAEALREQLERWLEEAKARVTEKGDLVAKLGAGCLRIHPSTPLLGFQDPPRISPPKASMNKFKCTTKF